MMECRLLDASKTGNVTILREILKQDPLVLDKIIVSCISETPLHVASTLGYLDFVKELVVQKPELTSELDSLGNSALHLASAKGHVEIVKELLVVVDPETCKLRNHDGRSPLHLASIKGRAKVVSQLLRAVPESVQLATDRGETALHLCVVHNRLEVLKMLVEEVKRDSKLLNWTDCEGNTILHVSVAKKNIEAIRFLLTLLGLNVNIMNRNGSTPLDVLTQGPRGLGDIEIESCLKNAGAISGKDAPTSITHDWDPIKLPEPTRTASTSPLMMTKTALEEPPPPPSKPKHTTDWQGRKKSALMVVASLIATVAFQAAITPPGGVWQDDWMVDENGNKVEQPHTAGTSIMAYSKRSGYGIFMIFNTLAFLASLSIILLLVSGLPIKRRRWMWIQMVIMWIAVTSQVITYFIALRFMSTEDMAGRLKDVTEISVLTWACLMSVVFFGNVIRMNLWVLRKFGYIKPKEEHVASIVDEDDDPEDEV